MSLYENSWLLYASLQKLIAFEFSEVDPWLCARTNANNSADSSSITNLMFEKAHFTQSDSIPDLGREHAHSSVLHRKFFKAFSDLPRLRLNFPCQSQEGQVEGTNSINKQQDKRRKNWKKEFWGSCGSFINCVACWSTFFLRLLTC